MRRLLACLCGLLLGAALGAPAEEAVQEIRVSAKKYEFNPSEIRVRAGARVRLVLTAEDRTHGFELKEVNVQQEIIKGKDTVVEFVAPAEPGTYEFKCSKFCGWGHRRMKGRLIVEPATETKP